MYSIPSNFIQFNSPMSDYIPEEIQLQIFHLLPVKTLLRFRCVCKSWREIIDSHSFARSHLAVQNRGFLEYKGPELLALDSLGLLDASKGPLQYADPMQYNFWPIGTLHGIVCLVHGEEAEIGIRLWNPSIRKVVSIPGPRDHWCGNTDELTTTYTSFWIDSSTKHLKIFVIIFGDSDDGECYLYSSVRRDWKEFHLPEVRYHRADEECPALVIGDVAYWTAEIDDATVVYSYDFVREAFDIIEVPLAKTEDGYGPTMCNWQDSLSLLYWGDEQRYNVYSRQGGSWVNVLRLSLPSETSNVCWVFWVQEDHGALVSCDLGADRDPMKYTRAIIRMNCWYTNCFAVYGHVESLLFP